MQLPKMIAETNIITGLCQISYRLNVFKGNFLPLYVDAFTFELREGWEGAVEIAALLCICK